MKIITILLLIGLLQSCTVNNIYTNPEYKALKEKVEVLEKKVAELDKNCIQVNPGWLNPIPYGPTWQFPSWNLLGDTLSSILWVPGQGSGISVDTSIIYHPPLNIKLSGDSIIPDVKYYKPKIGDKF